MDLRLVRWTEVSNDMDVPLTEELFLGFGIEAIKGWSKLLMPSRSEIRQNLTLRDILMAVGGLASNLSIAIPLYITTDFFRKGCHSRNVFTHCNSQQSSLGIFFLATVIILKKRRNFQRHFYLKNTLECIFYPIQSMLRIFRPIIVTKKERINFKQWSDETSSFFYYCFIFQ